MLSKLKLYGDLAEFCGGQNDYKAVINRPIDAIRFLRSNIISLDKHILNKNFPHGTIRTALGAFYNHSDDPNCRNVAGFWHQLPVKYLMTVKPIKAGEELTAQHSLYDDFDEQGN